MKIDFYDILNVDKNASPDEIKNAYRAMSKKCHPDIGGDQDEFQVIKKAYDVLKDPYSREYYNIHGETKEEKSDSFSDYIELAISIFNEAISKNPANIKLTIFEVYEVGKKNLMHQIDEQENEIKKTEKIVTRIEEFPKNDFIGNILASRIDNSKKNLEKINQLLENTDKAYELLNEYVFKIEERKSVY